MKVDVELRRLVNHGEVTLFVGAGLSIGAGLPGWIALIRPLALKVGYAMPSEDALVTSSHLIRAAQYFENEFGRHALIERLRLEIDRPDIVLTAAHHALVSLPVRVLFTTNFDDLLERAYRIRATALSIAVADLELAYTTPDRVQLVKICGDVRRPESIVITQQDYSTFRMTRPRIFEYMRVRFETSTPLFVGYSLQDPFINLIWDEIGVSFGRHRRRAFALMGETSEVELRDLIRRDIEPLVLRPEAGGMTEAMAAWLNSIASGGSGSDDERSVS